MYGILISIVLLFPQTRTKQTDPPVTQEATKMASLDGNWTDDKLSRDTGGALYAQVLNVSGTAIKGGHGQFVVNWIRQ